MASGQSVKVAPERTLPGEKEWKRVKTDTTRWTDLIPIFGAWHFLFMGMTKHGQKPTEDLSGWGLLTAALPKGGEPEAAPPQPRTISSLQQSHAHQQSVSSESYWFYFVPYPETKNLQAPFGNLLRDNLLQFLPLWMGPISSLSHKREGRAIHQPTCSKPPQFQTLGTKQFPSGCHFPII